MKRRSEVLDEFQFTHPRGVRCDGTIAEEEAQGFNSRTREGCDNHTPQLLTQSMFQFTHPRGVRYNGVMIVKSVDVSIHAPARGAMDSRTPSRTKASFNSRTREGCDEGDEEVQEAFLVSIHAPARGAIIFGCYFKDYILFQFTHPRGVRWAKPTKPNRKHCFNSRTREGCDKHSLNRSVLLWFQFTHPRGVRYGWRYAIMALISFNSRTREGCDGPLKIPYNIRPSKGFFANTVRFIAKQQYKKYKLSKFF